jgi:hypothetical protein
MGSISIMKGASSVHEQIVSALECKRHEHIKWALGAQYLSYVVV